MKPGAATSRSFAAVPSPKGWDFQYVNWALVETASGTGQSPWQPQLRKVPRYGVLMAYLTDERLGLPTRRAHTMPCVIAKTFAENDDQGFWMPCV